MPKRSSSSKRPKDINQTAASVVAKATGEPLRVSEKPKRKNPAAVALGRRGGLKGGKARAESLSAAERSEIAKRAAAARWKDKPAG
jgi:hypothetical protein